MVVCTIFYDKGQTSPFAASDSNCSGSNVPTTPYTDDGRGSSTNAGATISTATSTTATFLSAVDLTNIGNDGTDVIHIQTSSGSIHLHRITAITGSIGAVTALTISPASNVTESALAWSIGGLRNDLEGFDGTKPDWTDGLAGWRFSYEVGTSAYTTAGGIVLPNVGNTTDGPLEIVATSAFSGHANSPVIAWTASANAITVTSGLDLRLAGLSFVGTVSTSGAQRGVHANSGTTNIYVENVKVACSGSCFEYNSTVFGYISGCDLESTHTHGVHLKARSSVAVLNSLIHDCGQSNAAGTGILIDFSSTFGSAVVLSNRVVRSATSNISIAVNRGSETYYVSNNVLDESDGDGILLTGTAADNVLVVLLNNIITRSGGYGVNLATATSQALLLLLDHHAFGAGTFGNTSGNYNNLTAGGSDVAFASNTDPYTDSANDDYTLDATNGAAAIDAGFGYDG